MRPLDICADRLPTTNWRKPAAPAPIAVESLSDDAKIDVFTSLTTGDNPEASDTSTVQAEDDGAT
jgi:hypothetical protein